MKIFCIGRNYADHVKELKNELPTEPLIFMKPPTALLLDGKAFYYPDFTQDLHHEIEIVLRISKAGKHIEPQFAHKYFDALALGIDFTARDLQEKLKNKGNPWEIAKGFDGSAVLGKFLPLSEFEDLQNIDFQLTKNKITVQHGNTSDLIFHFDVLISHISKYFTLQQGDVIYTGTPAGVGAVQIGDRLEGFIGEKLLLECEIK